MSCYLSVIRLFYPVIVTGIIVSEGGGSQGRKIDVFTKLSGNSIKGVEDLKKERKICTCFSERLSPFASRKVAKVRCNVDSNIICESSMFTSWIISLDMNPPVPFPGKFNR